MDVYKFSHVVPESSSCGEGDHSKSVIPVPRSGHRIVVTDGNLYTLGGYNPDYWDVENSEDTYYPLFKELWQFNFVSRRWRKLNTSGNMPLQLASHAAVRDKNNLLAYGGTGVPFGVASSNELHVCNLTNHRWQHYPCKGDHPEKKYGHSMLLLDKYLYVCGGTTGFVYNMEVHRLDLQTLVWEKLSSDEEQKLDPEGRYRHEMAYHNDKLYVFGGGTAIMAYNFEMISAFNIPDRKWELVKTASDVCNGYPPARRCHSCCQQGNDVYMCGGMDGEKILSDFWRFSFNIHQWTKMSQQMPLPSYFHSADLAPNGCMYIFGGVTVIDDTRTQEVYRIWLKIPSLQELAWNSVICSIPDVDNVSRLDLAGLGVPTHFLDRLS